VDYLVRFFGHVMETRRPRGWPAVVEHHAVCRADNAEEASKYIANLARQIKIEQGMFSNFDLPGDTASDTEFGNGKFVPMHMLTHISFSVRRMDGEVRPQEEGGLIH